MNRMNEAVFETDKDLYNKKINPVKSPEMEIGVDLNNTVLDTIVETQKLDMNALNSFTQVSRNRNEIYDIIDEMGKDSILAAVLETYVEDATETNENGNVIWAESENPEALKFVTYLLNALNVDKNMYKWTHCLCKYGDVYLRLYRASDYEDMLFDKKKDTQQQLNESQATDHNETLNEDINIYAYSKNDRYVHYVEQEANPAQLFELTKFGKTCAYVKTDAVAQPKTDDAVGKINTFVNRFSFNKNDVDLYPPTEYVHGCLEDNSTRIPEEVELFIEEDNQTKKSNSYTVRRGQSLFYTTYKIWRQLMLLENSVLLNRVTQSSIVRVIGVEVGDMPKENVQPHLMNIKQLIEQKAALDVNRSMGEYSNPGPIINNVYIPTRNQQGVISTQQIGGDVNVGDLTDLSYYQDKLFGNLRVPKQYFGVTDDNAGFSGGTSLALMSSRYAKAIKRIQNVMVQLITDVINLILINTKNEAYINQFRLKMQAPTTQEEVDRRENTSNRIALVRDVMDMLTDVESIPTKLKILKSLLSNAITDTNVIHLLQEEIQKLEEEANSEMEEETAAEEPDVDFPEDAPLDIDSETDMFNDTSTVSNDATDASESSAEDDSTLPTPAELDIGDVSDASNDNL